MKNSIFFTSMVLLLLISCKREFKTSTDKAWISTELNVEGGRISGSETVDKSVLIFKGIPYAAPPTDTLRWKPPASVRPWEGILSCKSFSASPVQPDPEPFYMWSEEFLIPEAPISEDCLYLNIWAPREKRETKRPVLFWIHGGGFSSGSGSVPIYDGEAMARKGVVFVNFNYRLGIFGFFAHPGLSGESQTKTSGNYGLLDQLAALKWVKENIGAFGGDPNNITIAGQSAGSASVAFLIASALAKGMFDKAIAQSGAGLLPRIPGPKGSELETLLEAETVGLKISEDLNVSTIKELREMPAKELYQKVRFRGHPIMDGYVLPEDVSKIYQEGKQNNVSLLTGWNEDDGVLIGGGKSKEDYRRDISENWGNSASGLLSFYPATNDSITKISQRDLQRDLTFGAQNYHLANLLSDQGKNVYVYRFKRDVPDGKQEDYGAFHTGEVPYAYNNLDLVDRPFEEVDRALADTMSSYWANFAKTGNPNGGELPNWSLYKYDSKQIIILDKEIEHGKMEDAEQLDFLIENLIYSDRNRSQNKISNRTAAIHPDMKTTQKAALAGEIVVGDKTFEVVYQNNPTSQSFMAQMPFSTVLEDYAGKEKIFDPKEAVSKKNAPSGAKPISGDIMFYGPWGNIAIFYKEAPYASGLIPIGRIEDVIGFIEALAGNQNKATFKKVN